MDIVMIILRIVVLFMALTVHEFAHGWMARKLGDRTAEAQGRLSLNPKDHIDPIGTLLLPFFLAVSGSPIVFGWAKPVPINPLNFRNPRKGMMWSALAGPIANFLFASIGILLFKLLVFSRIFFEPFLLFLLTLILINLFLALFNLIPIPPLDGGRVLVGLLPPEQAYAYSKIEPYGFMIVIVLMYLDVFDRFLYAPITLVLRFLGVQ